MKSKPKPSCPSELFLQNKLHLILRAFIISQFSYYPSVWMCRSRNINNKINKLNPSRNKAVNIHHQNLQMLPTEKYEEEYGVASGMMNDIVRQRNIQTKLERK